MAPNGLVGGQVHPDICIFFLCYGCFIDWYLLFEIGSICQSLGLSVRGLFEGLSYRSACSMGDEGRGEMVDMFFALGKVTKRGYDCACKHVHVSLYDCVTV